MKILIVDRANAFSIWTLMNAVAAAAIAEGHEVVYCVLDLGAVAAPPPPPGVRVHRIAASGAKTMGGRLGRWLGFSRAFIRLLRRERPDLVHTNFCDPGIPARLIARAMGVRRVVSTYHELRGSLNPLYRLGLAMTDWTAARRVYVSRACARSFGAEAAELLETPGARPQARDVVIRNGAAVRRPEGARPDPRRTPPRLVFAGRLMPEKGADALIAAAGLLESRGTVVDLDLFGDGPARPALEAAARRLSGRTTFHGWSAHDATLRAVAEADCVAIPSDGAQEGFGLALAEALILAPRIVASDIPVFRELTGGLEAGVTLCAPADPTALADAIGQALAAPDDSDAAAERRAEAARRFDIARMARIYLELYRGAG